MSSSPFRLCPCALNIARTILLLLCVPGALAQSYLGQIAGVKNGEDFIFSSAGKSYHVRLIGLACPVALKGYDQPFARDAIQVTQNFNKLGRLRLEVVAKINNDLCLGWIDTEDRSVSLNATLLFIGFAEIEDHHFLYLLPKVRESLVYYESLARNSHRGIWSVKKRESAVHYRQRLRLNR